MPEFLPEEADRCPYCNGILYDPPNCCNAMIRENSLLSQAELLKMEVNTLQNAIRKHRDYRGDDRCWRDDEELYEVLPEGYTSMHRDTLVELQNCANYILCRHSPNTEYVSPQRRIEQLEEENKRLRGVIRELQKGNSQQYY